MFLGLVGLLSLLIVLLLVCLVGFYCGFALVCCSNVSFVV